MSWELMSTNKQLCPCSKGFVIEKRYKDDWNRTNVECYFECKDCNEKQIQEQKKQERDARRKC